MHIIWYSDICSVSSFSRVSHEILKNIQLKHPKCKISVIPKNKLFAKSKNLPYRIL